MKRKLTVTPQQQHTICFTVLAENISLAKFPGLICLTQKSCMLFIFLGSSKVIIRPFDCKFSGFFLICGPFQQIGWQTQTSLNLSYNLHSMEVMKAEEISFSQGLLHQRLLRFLSSHLIYIYIFYQFISNITYWLYFHLLPSQQIELNANFVF